LRRKILLAVFVILFSLSSALFADAPYIINMGPDGVQRTDMVAGSYFFKPDYISVKAKAPVEITIRKEGLTPHRFVLNAPDAGMNIKEGLSTEPKAIRFTPLKPGKYEFYCDEKLPLEKSHREKGMKGVLEVRE
jgi:plastocyanin